jgi:hypothetical protein
MCTRLLVRALQMWASATIVEPRKLLSGLEGQFATLCCSNEYWLHGLHAMKAPR